MIPSFLYLNFFKEAADDCGVMREVGRLFYYNEALENLLMAGL